MIGQTLGGYRVIEQIGMGGMATVYKAYDPGTDRYIALKTLPSYSAQDPKFRERFRREAKAIARLEHPHILPIHAFGDDKDTVYLVMRYLPGGTLKERLARGPMPFAEIGTILTQVADALDYAHEHHILHRDVKPSNVLLDEKGNTYLSDFGIAKMVEATVDLTAGALLGTPQYMSPEQCQGSTVLTSATDQYSLGVVLYEMLTGRAPFQADTPLAVIHMHLSDPLPLPRSLRADLPEHAETVLLKALAKKPGDRWPSCSALATAFNQALPGAAEAVVPSSPQAITVDQSAASRPAVRRFPAWAWGLIGVVAIAALVIGGLAISGMLAGQGAPTRQAAAAVPTAALTLYDDFGSPAYDGSFNPALWTTDSQSATSIRQQSGALVMRQADRPNYGTSVVAFKYSNFTLDTPVTFQADMKADEQEHTGAVHMFLRSDPDQQSNFEEIQCGIDAEAGWPGAQMSCWDRWNMGKEPQVDSYAIPKSLLVAYGTWHTARIEVDPASMTLTYYLDGQLVGSHTPTRAQDLKSRRYMFAIGLYAPASDPVTGFFDNVRIEPTASASPAGPATPAPAQSGGAEQARAFAAPILAAITAIEHWLGSFFPQWAGEMIAR